MPLQVIRQDITKVKADAIVSASGHFFASHGDVSRAIFEAAGPELQAECGRTGYLGTAEVLVTGAYRLPAGAVIHTVGPAWEDGRHGEAVLLRKCYENCMAAAWERGFRSVAFPLISSGGYGFPKEHALQAAMESIAAFEHFDEMEVTLTVCDPDSYEVSRELLSEVTDYIGGNEDFPLMSAGLASEPEERAVREEDTGYRSECPDYVKKRRIPEKQNRASGGKTFSSEVPAGLEEFLKYRDESFKEMLNRLILERNVSSSEIYKAANVSRAVFSNIFTKKGYRVRKGTALALAVALKLDLKDTKAFLAKAGHAMSHAFRQDLVVEYCIVHKIYNIFEINEILFTLDLPTLGEKTW